MASDGLTWVVLGISRRFQKLYVRAISYWLIYITLVSKQSNGKQSEEPKIHIPSERIVHSGSLLRPPWIEKIRDSNAPIDLFDGGEVRTPQVTTV